LCDASWWGFWERLQLCEFAFLDADLIFKILALGLQDGKKRCIESLGIIHVEFNRSDLTPQIGELPFYQTPSHLPKPVHSSPP
jgi:hypothetical protein